MASEAIRAEASVVQASWSAFTRRKVAFFLTALLVFVLGAAVVAVLRPNFTATSNVVLDITSPQAVSIADVISGAASDDESIATEIQVLTSYDLAKQVILQLHLDQNPDFNPELSKSFIHVTMKSIKAWVRQTSADIFGPSAEFPTNPMNAMVDIFERSLKVEQVEKSRVIGLTFTAHDPEVAAAAANALALAYTNSRVDLVRTATRDANDWIKNELGRLRERADTSTAAARKFRDDHGLMKTADATLLQQEIGQVQTQLTAAKASVAQAQAASSEADRALSTGNADRLSTVLGSTLIGRLREQEATAAATASQAASTLGPQHPAVRSAQAALRDVQGKISSEIQRIHRSIHGDLDAAQNNERMLEARLKEVSSNIALTGPAETQLEELERTASIDSDLYTTFLTRSRQTAPELTYAPVNARIQSLAVIPTVAKFPRKPVLLALVMVLAGMAGAVSVLISELRARGLRSPGSVERLGLVSLGQVPFLRGSGKPIDRLLHAEALSDVVSNLMLGQSDAPRSVLVTSSLPQEGKTHFSLALGRLVASRGLKVLIIDADLRKSSMTKLLSPYAARRGLAEILAGKANPSDAFFADGVGGAIVLPSGNCIGEPATLLGSPAFGALLRKVEAEVDLVIIDAPPVLAGADAKLIAPHAKHTIFLARWGRTDVDIVQEALIQLVRAGVTGLGVVLSMVDLRRSATYDRGTKVKSSRGIRRYYKSVLASEAARGR